MGHSAEHSLRAASPGFEAEAVRAWLIANPDFVAAEAATLARLLPCGRADDKIVDLPSMLLARLRGELTELRAAQEMLVATAECNMERVAQIHDAVLAVISARSLEHLTRRVTRDFAEMFETPVVALAIETDAEPEDDFAGVLQLAPGEVDAILGRGVDALLREDVEGDARLYGDAGLRVASEALVRLTLSPRGPDGLIAFGAAEANRFHEDQGADLLIFLAATVSRALNRWLNLPPF